MIEMVSGDDMAVFERRFWAKVDKSGECWVWNGAREPKVTGYGRFRFAGKTVASHRLAYEMAHGPIPDGLFVCHHCDNRWCVRPDHCFLGTNSDNIRDAWKKGRGKPGRVPVPRHGELHSMAKLTQAMVDDLRTHYPTAGLSRRAWARKFNVSPYTIRGLLRREWWTRGTGAGLPDAPNVTLHPCAIPNCGRLIVEDRLLCWDHWLLVPKRLKNQLGADGKQVGVMLPQNAEVREAALAIVRAKPPRSSLKLGR